MDRGKAKLLIVDDDPFICEILAAILEGSGYSVHTAQNGSEALAALNTISGISLIITDLNMPAMNGLELIRNIRALGKELPAIILTGETDMSATPGLNEAGCDILVKDENIQETIGTAVSDALKKHGGFL